MMSRATAIKATLTATGATAVLVAASTIGPVAAQPSVHAQTHAVTASARNATWTAGWRAAAQQPFTTGVSSTGFTDQTVRMNVRSEATGNSVRIRLSNAYGTAPVAIGSATVALQSAGPEVAAKSVQTVTFDRSGSTSIPAGAEIVSDPAQLSVHRGDEITVSVFLPDATGPTTWHYEAEQTTYISQPGDWTSEPGGSPYQAITPSWFYLDGLDVHGPAPRGTIVAFGDSITDGHYSTIDANGRWPDWVARRATDFSVVDEGIGGNQILKDVPTAGVSALNRLDRDMIDQLGVTDVIFLEGINDIGSSDATAAQVIAGMQQIISAAHAKCINILGGTLTPFEGASYYSPARELVREAVNQWIRTSGAFDGVVDFDKAVRDPQDPLRLNPKYDTGGGHLHPNDLGYKAMGNAVKLNRLEGSPQHCS